MVRRGISYRRLVAADLARIGEIDRTECIETLYVQHGTRLEERVGDWSAPAWASEGEGEHSVAHQRAECERHLAAGGIALGAFSGRSPNAWPASGATQRWWYRPRPPPPFFGSTAGEASSRCQSRCRSF